MSETAAAGAPALAVAPRRAWQALGVLLIGMFMSLLDATIVNVALPTIRTSLDANEATLSWIISGYALAFGLVLIPAGRLGDRFGHKWIFFTGLALFTAASLACGLAQDSTQLVVARVIQGLAGGIYLPAVTAFIQLLFPPRVRGKAFAIMGAVIGVSSALGPIVGGLLIQAFGEKEGWRYVFDVNLPIGIIALVAAAFLLPRGAAGTRSSGGGDWIGLLLLAGGLVAILVPLIEGQTVGWKPWTFISLGGGVALIVLFAFWEVFYTKRGKSPLVPPHLYSHPAFTGGTILALVYFAAFTSIFFSISILWQSGLGHTALESGLVSIPFAIGSIVGASQSNRFAARLGRTVLVIGVGMLTVGLAAVWIILLTVPAADLTNWALLLPLLVAGVGSGLFIAPNAQFIVATVDPQEAGAASGVIGTMQRLGSAIGIAVIGSVLFGTLVIEKPTFTGRPSAAEIKAAVAQNVAIGFTASAASAIALSALFALVAFSLVFALPKRVNRGFAE
ncbi:MFS transporter [Lacisediminihabitans profunda]|uniref:MFS transporter n=1 Tax=Lacisediminihabitans profunda TaxID=2594790 RepID=A0A5C8UUN1_9MICO|nr:MFS transporter [Lacisediminihabitans profunda]TXN31346.1 MFS transporter [Lacisediminihabitans profunda]